MPTGYTADVADGKISDLTSFAWLCARAFGALVSLRDEPMATTKPAAFEASDYHVKELTAARAEVSRLTKMTSAEKTEAYRLSQENRRAEREMINAERAEKKTRYEAMLAQVRAWEPPTAEHVGLREFMERQLVESIDFDCKPVDEYYPDLPAMKDWADDEMKEAIRSCEYHAGELEKDRVRTESRNAWVEALDRSLAARDKESQP